jgi:hypothetical protein
MERGFLFFRFFTGTNRSANVSATLMVSLSNSEVLLNHAIDRPSSDRLQDLPDSWQLLHRVKYISSL